MDRATRNGRLTDAMGTVLAVFDLVSDAISDNLKTAGDAVETELALKKRQNEKSKLLFELGATAYEKGKIDTKIVDRLKVVDDEIEDLLEMRGKRTTPKDE